MSIIKEIDPCGLMPVTFEDDHSSKRLGVMFSAPKSHYGVLVNKPVKISEVYLEELPRVIGRGLSDIRSGGIR